MMYQMMELANKCATISPQSPTKTTILSIKPQSLQIPNANMHSLTEIMVSAITALKIALFWMWMLMTNSLAFRYSSLLTQFSMIHNSGRATQFLSITIKIIMRSLQGLKMVYPRNCSRAMAIEDQWFGKLQN